ncbi:hypothetical protein CCP3SC15_520008 [Gammaproteobacteria bacterium]
MNEDNQSTFDTIQGPQNTSATANDGSVPPMIKDDVTVQSSSPDSGGVKHSPLSPKWWSSKKEEKSDPLSENNKAEIVNVDTTTANQSPSNKDELVTPVMLTDSTDTQTEIKGPESTSLPPSTPISDRVKETMVSATSPVKPVVAAGEEGQILKTISDVASKAIERGKSRLDHFGISKKPENVAVATAPEKPSSLSPRSSFVTTAEKELRLKEIREAAAQKIEKNKALHAQQPVSVAAQIDEEKPEEVTAPTTVALQQIIQQVQQPIEIATTEVEAPREITLPPSLDSLDTLVPPPPRPVGPSSQNKMEIRSAAQARINEAYLRQIKGEEPEPLADKPQESKKSSKPREDGRREVPLESLGTGVFNALGDMVGGVVHLARTMSGGVKKVVATNPTSQTSATTRMALGAQEVVTGAKEIIKGGGNIVIGTIGMVTVPVIAAIRSIQSTGKSESKET